MFELGKHVPVVPVVTKADTMTIREANTYRTEVANRIANPMVPGEHSSGSSSSSSSGSSSG
jgi:septin 7